MKRQSVSITNPNDVWLKAQVESEEYASKSEVVNDLIRKARAEQDEIEQIRARLMQAEKSGFVDASKTPEQFLADIKEKANRNGEL